MLLKCELCFLRGEHTNGVRVELCPCCLYWSLGPEPGRMCRDCNVSVFEMTIRGVGGLLAAHDLSGDAVFLERCARMSVRRRRLSCRRALRRSVLGAHAQGRCYRLGS